MKVGRNWPCPCGSGKKYKRCCIDNNETHGKEQVIKIDGRKVRAYEAYVDIESGVVHGFDQSPDIKHWIENAISEFNIEDGKKFSKMLPRIMQEYNERINEVNSKLPRELGVMFNDARELMGSKKYREAISINDIILEVFPESVEAQGVKGRALFSLKEHPLQQKLNNIVSSEGKYRKLMIEEFGNETVEVTVEERELVLPLIIELYMSAKNWEGKNLALNVLKECVVSYCKDGATEEVDALLLKALCDKDGRVRNNAVYTAKSRRCLDVPIDFFFKVADKASREKDSNVKRGLCRVILEWAAPITDWVMEEEGISKEYRAAIEMALESTGYAPEYYRASPDEKMKMGLLGTKTKGRMTKLGNAIGKNG